MANMTFKVNLVPYDGTQELGSSNYGWKITKISAPTTSGGTTYGAGSDGQVLKSNGTTVYWANDTNSDTNVTQTATTTAANYEVLFSVTADNTTRTEGARKNSNLKFNPSTGNLTVTSINGLTISLVT